MFAPQGRRPVTSADVARHAGVSRATVSFVLNDRRDVRVSHSTRQRVIDAATRLGYTPNVSASALRKGETQEIFIPIGTVEMGVDLTTLLTSFIKRASARGFEVQASLHRNRSGPSAAAEWARRRPVGVIALAADCDEAATEVLRQAGVQALVVIGPTLVEYAPTLVVSQVTWAQAAVDYLTAKGHRALAYLRPSHNDPYASARWEQLLARATEAGATIEEVRGDYDPQSLRPWAETWRSGPARATGLIAYDDPLAFAAINALHHAGIAVPDDVAVLGAGDHQISRLFVPTVSSVSVDWAELVDSLLGTMLRMLGGETVAEVPMPPVQVVTRESA